ncbi:hypothetical protein BLNAU_20680 [Blattamonas nauphoetae]|uniref:CCHC-type domain-containing protein n=1 Tax=Blattamonas nauphoetae TaxID=2049346 RepID=A0ABQ9X2A3_9EUKA|nr:hypothetical protein BLNAU_20680 [Blattamonas nauphoetae]
MFSATSQNDFDFGRTHDQSQMSFSFTHPSLSFPTSFSTHSVHSPIFDVALSLPTSEIRSDRSDCIQPQSQQSKTSSSNSTTINTVHFSSSGQTASDSQMTATALRPIVPSSQNSSLSLPLSLNVTLQGCSPGTLLPSPTPNGPATHQPPRPPHFTLTAPHDGLLPLPTPQVMNGVVGTNTIPREMERCFKCGQTGHIFVNCPLHRIHARESGPVVDRNACYKDPVKRIAAFINLLHPLTLSIHFGDINPSKNLLSQCLQHTATFLNAHPDLIDSFLRTVDLSSSPSDTPFRHDRHLNLISALSQSSSPLFTKLSEPLLNPKFRLRSLLSPRSFTDPASSFLRIASTNPAFFRRLVENHAERILNVAVSTAVNSVRVVSDSPSEPHCLDFGRATQNWVVLLKAMAEVKLDLTTRTNDFISLPSSLLTLLVLSAASTHDELSTAAVSVFSNQFGLSTPHTETLLFATPTTFPVTDAFTPRDSRISSETDHNPYHCQSIYAEVGRSVVMQSRFEDSSETSGITFMRKLGIPLAGCLVNALHSTTTLRVVLRAVRGQSDFARGSPHIAWGSPGYFTSVMTRMEFCDGRHEGGMDYTY